MLKLIFLTLLIFYLGISLGTYVRILTAKKVKGALIPSLFSPFFFVLFVFYGFRLVHKKEISIKTFINAIRHGDDVLFLYVVLILGLNNRINKEPKKRDGWGNLNTDIYDGLQAY